MITKLLFTLTVIVGTLIFFKKQRAQQATRPRAVKAAMTENQKMFRQGAYLFLILMILSALGMFIFNFGKDSATMQVRVINTQTGKSEIYLAEKKDIKSSSFTTVKGRQVFVADVERIEIEPLD